MGIFNLTTNVKGWGIKELIEHFNFGASLSEYDIIEIKELVLYYIFDAVKVLQFDDSFPLVVEMEESLMEDSDKSIKRSGKAISTTTQKSGARPEERFTIDQIKKPF